MTSSLYYELVEPTKEHSLSDELKFAFRKVFNEEYLNEEYLYSRDVDRIELMQKFVSEKAAKELHKIIQHLLNERTIKLWEER